MENILFEATSSFSQEIRNAIIEALQADLHAINTQRVLFQDDCEIVDIAGITSAC